MVTAVQNDRLTQVGPDTSMGRMLREYWYPALLSEELTPACDPMPLRLLGEDLVAFRDSAGRVGILPEYCPHRTASLTLAKVEENGLRCLYHGWVLDVHGRVIEVPNEPEDSTRKLRVAPTGYQVREVAGMIWVYMGEHSERKSAPPFPAYAWTSMPNDRVMRMKAITRSNYLQNVEGVIDSVHTNFLHSTALRPAANAMATTMSADALVRPSLDKHPKLRLQDTSYGFRYGAIRKPITDPDKNQYVRTTLWIAPNTVTFPASAGEGFMQIFVPIDEETTIFWSLRYSFTRSYSVEETENYAKWAGLARDGDLLDEAYRVRRTKANRWMQDRAAMRRGDSFSGIKGVNTEDMAMAESMGAVARRHLENLGPTDLAVVHMRRLMLQSLDRYEQGGRPVGMAEPVAYDCLRADDRVIPLDTPWQTVGAFAGEPVTGEGPSGAMDELEPTS